MWQTETHSALETTAVPLPNPHTPDRGPFAPHMKRLHAYLKQADLSILSEDHREIVSRVLEAVEKKAPVPRVNSKAAADFIQRRRMSAEQVWELLTV